MLAGLLFERNSVLYFNAFTGLTPALDSVVRLNEFAHQGPNVDGAAVHVHIKPQNGILGK